MLLFPGDRYYTEASSSSIATAISTGVPLIVDQRFSEVYTFIPQSATVVAVASSHATAMEQILQLTADQWTEKSNAVSRLYWNALASHGKSYMQGNVNGCDSCRWL